MHYKSLVIISFVIHSYYAVAQVNQEWGLSVQPSLSKAKFPRGVGASYAGAPFFSGDLKVTERDVFGMSLTLFREQTINQKNFKIRADAGFSSVGALQTLKYDYANSLNNIKSVEKRYDYLTVDLQLKYCLKIDGLVPFLSAGVHSGYILRSMETHTNYVPVDNQTTTHFSQLRNEKHLNFGHRLEAGVRVFRFSFSVFYKSFWYTHYDHQGKRVVNLGLSFSYHISVKHREDRP